MTVWSDLRALLAVTLAASLACPPVHALVALNDGRDRIYVNGSVTIAHDSNVFASNGSAGDYVYSTSLSADYTRRAGWIGVNANIGVSSSKFAEIEGQDFSNPAVGIEFVKQSGRTTGSLTLNAQRQSRADAAVNSRVESWNYNVGLGVKYPISGTLTASGNFGYSNTIYSGSSALFSDLATYSAGLDLFHILTTERDLVGGYRYRFGETSRSTSYSDHSFTTGVSGKVIRGIKGSLRGGYQFRVPHGSTNTATFSSWTANGSLAYAINKKMNLSAALAKDFSTTATDAFVDTLTASLDFQYAYSSRWSFSSGISYGNTRFLGDAGRVVLELGPPLVLGPEREDSFLSWNANLNYAMNEHLRVAITYSWFRNWSTSTFADFERQGYSLTISSRW